MDRAERLLDLVTLFLGATELMSFDRLRDHFDDYQAVSLDSALRKFERDKAELLELGLPLTYEAPDDEGEGGYRLDPDAYFLPKLDLSPAELTLLGVAGSAAQTMESFPFKAEVARALEKIGFAARSSETDASSAVKDGPLSPLSSRLSVHSRPRGDPARVGAAFAALQDAIGRRKRTTLDYHALYEDKTTRREVEPHGLFLRDGAWALQARCLLRDAPRTFLLDRIVSFEVNSRAPKRADFEPPVDLDLLALARLRPWAYPVNAPQEVRLRLEAAQAFQAKALFGDEARVTPLADGAVEVRLELRYPEPLIERVLSLRGACTLLAPASLREELRARLSAVEKLHRAPGP